MGAWAMITPIHPAGPVTPMMKRRIDSFDLASSTQLLAMPGAASMMAPPHTGSRVAMTWPTMA